jgi:hypothetical protein
VKGDARVARPREVAVELELECEVDQVEEPTEAGLDRLRQKLAFVATRG